MIIKRARSLAGLQQQLVELLQDAVNSGASIGFIAPLYLPEAEDYWLEVEQQLQAQQKLLLVALEEDEVLGAVQLALVSKANGLHRAEVEKLMVHTCARRKGVAKALMEMLETLAAEQKRELLVLDTRMGDAAFHLYESLGYQQAGIIPDFAINAQGAKDPTVYFYKSLT